jgi:hypothetical protein
MLGGLMVSRVGLDAVERRKPIPKMEHEFFIVSSREPTAY